MRMMHRRANRCAVLWGAVLAMAACGPGARADTHYVDPNSAKPAAPYTSRKTAAHDIQSAVNAAESGDTVQVAAGKYAIGKTIGIGKAITVQGAGAEKTTIDAQSKCRVVNVVGGATLKGFTITGGKAREGAGASCGAGGTIAECTISKNTAERYGGGGSCRAKGRALKPALLIDCKIINNRVTNFWHTDYPFGGGGVYAEGSVVVRNCRIEGNESAQRGGGLWLHGGGTRAENSVIVGNRAYGKRRPNPNGPGSMDEGGGGVFCDFGAWLQNCLIYGNVADKIGGGVILSTGSRARNCTVVGNHSKNRGGGIQTLGVARVFNSILYGNTQGAKKEPSDLFVSHYYHVDIHQLMLGKIFVQNSCIGALKIYHTRQRFYLGRTAGYTPNQYKNKADRKDCIDKDPQFVDPAKHDYRLKGASPCIDAGAGKLSQSGRKDLAGKPRQQGAAIDMGAYEVQSDKPTTRPADATATPSTKPTTRPARPKGLRVLLVGNSHLYFNELPMMLNFLSKHGGRGPIEVGMCCPGGCTLAGHCGQGKPTSPALKLIDKGRYDYVVLQEHHEVPYTKPDDMQKYARLLDERIRKSGAKTIFFMTWVPKNLPEKQPAVTAAYINIARECGAYLAPVGLAWQRVLKADPRVVFHRSDNHHPQRTGTYLAACVLYSVIHGRSPEGLPGRIVVKRRGKYTPLVRLPDAYSLVLQRFAWATVGSLDATKPMQPKATSRPGTKTS